MRLLWLFCLTACPEPEALMRCNGSEALCARDLTQIATATTHNAMSNHEDGWTAPNQLFGMSQQLQDGIRAMMLDIYLDEGQLKLCHGVCWAGSLELSEGLKLLADFLAEHPNEVLTLILESYVDTAELLGAFSQAGLASQLHHQKANEAWPSLAEMIKAGRRMVVLTDRGADASAGLLPMWDHAFDTPFAAESKDDLVCDLGRGNSDNALFIFNHFLTAPLASPELAETINYNPFFLERVRSCTDQTGRSPNFLTVDFYSLGDVLTVVQTLNDAL